MGIGNFISRLYDLGRPKYEKMPVSIINLGKSYQENIPFWENQEIVTKICDTIGTDKVKIKDAHGRIIIPLGLPQPDYDGTFSIEKILKGLYELGCGDVVTDIGIFRGKYRSGKTVFAIVAAQDRRSICDIEVFPVYTKSDNFQ